MKELISTIISNVLKEKKIKIDKKEIINQIEIPPSPELGDFSFPCFLISKILKAPPEKVAIELRILIGSPPEEFEDIQTNGPYINFFVNRKKLSLEIINKILSNPSEYGKNNLGNSEKILIEHTSINPNASPHVGRARNALIGDSLTRIFKFLNFNPEVHYYVNDVSKQIAMLVYAGAEKMNFEKMLNEYIKISEKIKKQPEIEKEIFVILEKFEKEDPEIKEKFKKITKTCVEGQKKILYQLGINYDYFDYESDYIKYSAEILKKFQDKKRLLEDENGRYFLDLKNSSVQGKMKSPVLVLTRSDKTGLYPLRDIAYTIEKIKKAKRNIIVLGEDQKLYFLQIKEALNILGFQAPDVVHYSYILISDKGKSKKMSTRKGNLVLLEDFLKKAIEKAKKNIKKRKSDADPVKIGIGAVKYAILKNHNNKVINFNLDEALSFEGDTGPYLLYSYARANSITKKIKKSEKPITIKELHDKEIEIIKKFSEFENAVLRAFNELNPSYIANYSYQLSKIFNEFYHSCPVIGSEQEEFRIAIVECFKLVLKNSLSLLGIETIESM